MIEKLNEKKTKTKTVKFARVLAFDETPQFSFDVTNIIT